MKTIKSLMSYLCVLFCICSCNSSDSPEILHELIKNTGCNIPNPQEITLDQTINLENGKLLLGSRNTEAWIARYDNDGNELWNNTHTTTDNNASRFFFTRNFILFDQNIIFLAAANKYDVTNKTAENISVFTYDLNSGDVKYSKLLNSVLGSLYYEEFGDNVLMISLKENFGDNSYVGIFNSKGENLYSEVIEGKINIHEWWNNSILIENNSGITYYNDFIIIKNDITTLRFENINNIFKSYYSKFTPYSYNDFVFADRNDDLKRYDFLTKKTKWELTEMPLGFSDYKIYNIDDLELEMQDGSTIKATYKLKDKSNDNTPFTKIYYIDYETGKIK